jgi:hypothetical protein
MAVPIDEDKLAIMLHEADRAEYAFCDIAYREILKRDRDDGYTWEECTGETQEQWSSIAKRLLKQVTITLK